MSVKHRVLTAHPNAVPEEDFRFEDHGAGLFIAFWNSTKLGPQPAIEDLPDGSALEQEEQEEVEAIEKLGTDLDTLIRIVDDLAEGRPTGVPPEMLNRALRRENRRNRPGRP